MNEENSSCVLALDCGATSLRAMVVDSSGAIIGQARRLNNTISGEESSDYHLWDADKIYQQLCECSREAVEGIDCARIRAVTVTTFGVDGALVDGEGRMLYPVISWKCPRTAEVMERISQYISQEELNNISGVGAFAFNTIYKLIWLKENRPELLQQAKAWLFISSLLNYKLSGVMTTDRTMAGTSQLTDIEQGDFSPQILDAIGISSDLFPPMVSAGEVIGTVTSEAADLLGISGISPVVVSAGHDTQFAVFGSGAKENQPVLSSGTWEILMVRTPKAALSSEDFADGATIEYDAIRGLLNPGLQWLGSGVLEWLTKMIYPHESYEIMEEEGGRIPPGSEGVTVVPDFLPSGKTHGSINGLVLSRTRAHIYRATLEALTYQLRLRLARLESLSGFKSDSLILVGGGSRNRLWTQIRADVLGIPVLVTHESEITVLGAAMFAFSGAGVYNSPEESREAFALSYETFVPGDQQDAYTTLIPH